MFGVPRALRLISYYLSSVLGEASEWSLIFRMPDSSSRLDVGGGPLAESETVRSTPAGHHSPATSSGRDDQPLRGDWEELLTSAQEGTAPIPEQIMSRVLHPIRRLLRQRVAPEEVDSVATAVFESTVLAIRRGHVRSYRDLPKMVRALVERVPESNRPVLTREPSGGEALCYPGVVPALVHVLRGLSEQQKNAIWRFYVDGILANQVCQETGISMREFAMIAEHLRQTHRSLVRRGSGSSENRPASAHRAASAH